MKILILVLSCLDKPFHLLMKRQQETWDSIPNENIKTIYYYGNGGGFKKIKNNEPIEIMDTFRYVLSLEEFLYWIDLIIVGRKNEMNILGRKMKISEIIEEIKLNKL